MNTEFTQSRSFRIILIVIVTIVLLMAGFSLGERVGFRKASFAYQNGNNFYQAFGPNGAHGMTAFPDAHGTVGKVVSVALPSITIEDRDSIEKTVVISDQTVIRHFRETITAKDIAIGDYIVAIGDPNADSQIAATLIRILPPPPAGTSTQTAQ